MLAQIGRHNNNNNNHIKVKLLVHMHYDALAQKFVDAQSFYNKTS